MKTTGMMHYFGEMLNGHRHGKVSLKDLSSNKYFNDFYDNNIMIRVGTDIIEDELFYGDNLKIYSIQNDISSKLPTEKYLESL